jgi:hypothetical protein
MKKILNTEVLEPIIVFIGSLLFLEFIVFPGLTINNTLLNICTGVIVMVFASFLIIYLRNKFRTTFENNEDLLIKSPFVKTRKKNKNKK